jgi:uncharacterized membrane-anchored protein
MLSTHRVSRKVPEITALFWIIKLLTTAMGEATSDFMVASYNQYLAVFVGGCALAIALLIQFKTRIYNPWAYWFTVSMVAVFGTMAADGLHIQLHVPYIASSIFFAIVLALVFIVWQKRENTLSIHSINTRRREAFYWTTVLATFALGTALGDLTATTFKLGYFSAGLVFFGLILVPAVIYWVTKRNEILWFWAAYVLTRPLGASFADWTSKSKNIGGLGFGDGHVAIILASVILLLVANIPATRFDIQKTEQQ